jgi:hypothetical protein
MFEWILLDNFNFGNDEKGEIKETVAGGKIHKFTAISKIHGTLEILLPRICRVVGLSGCRQIEK